MSASSRLVCAHALTRNVCASSPASSLSNNNHKYNYMIGVLLSIPLRNETARARAVGATDEFLLHQYCIDFRVLLIHRHLLNELLIICKGDYNGTYTQRGGFPLSASLSVHQVFTRPPNEEFILRVGVLCSLTRKRLSIYATHTHTHTHTHTLDMGGRERRTRQRRRPSHMRRACACALKENVVIPVHARQ